MDNPIDISIVIVNYNVKDFLHQCLTSIENATNGLSIEVIVVDNASTDGSMDFIEPLFPDYKFIRSAENLGFAKANNIAIKQALGKYLLILNPDTILAEDTLTEMLSYMNSNREVGIAGCKVLNSDGSFQIQCRRGFPTPWASFCKLFGLQKLFPNSKLFAKYNQTFQPIDATYYIDAVIGAFMFCDTKLIQDIGGFDENYFMYGEDLDLCRQVQLHNRKVAYYHKTSIIHFKGESTRRSSLNEIKQQYDAMEKFARKYFSNSMLFIFFLRMGIVVRSLIARVTKHKLPIFIILADLLFINLSYIIGTYAKFGNFFGLPDYAYPLVFIVLSLVFFLAQFLNGEYFEKKISIPNTILSLMLSFFILSTFPYFFPSFRFSRGALLVAIGVTSLLSVLLRIGIIVFERVIGKHSDRRVIIAGCDAQVDVMIAAILNSEMQNINILGIVSTAEKSNYTSNHQYLGNLADISIIAQKNKADEVIITDTNLPTAMIMQFMSGSNQQIKYHIIPEYDELVISRIINDISNTQVDLYKYNINKPRFKFLKRTSDILLSILSLTLFMPYLLVGSKSRKNIGKWWSVLIGHKTAIGVYSAGGNEKYWKEGIISLAQINHPELLSINAINKLNDYYMQNYSLSLDIDIIIKYFIRRK
ncbi:MAG: glycosyltransferase [Ignavibacteria bacterium]|jgi:GT2 family glycosyltransferase|nr:glycosyltransferase [Ignavibacteria bacterium]